MYWIGLEIEPELDCAIEFKFNQLGPVYMGEGSWPCLPKYARLTGKKNTWAGTERYRTRIRDSFYLGLIHRMPIMLTWDEQHTEDEHLLLNQICRRVDWKQEFQAPIVNIKVDNQHVLEDGRKILAEFESICSSIPISSAYLLPDQKASGETSLVFDACQDKDLKELFAKSAELEKQSPLQMSKGYRAQYLWSKDKCTLLAYIYNVTNHETIETAGDLSGNLHRLPTAADLSIKTQLIPEGLQYRLYDLNDKCIVEQGSTDHNLQFERSITSHDVFLLIEPEK